MLLIILQYIHVNIIITLHVFLCLSCLLLPVIIQVSYIQTLIMEQFALRLSPALAAAADLGLIESVCPGTRLKNESSRI